MYIQYIIIIIKRIKLVVKVLLSSNIYCGSVVANENRISFAELLLALSWSNG